MSAVEVELSFYELGQAAGVGVMRNLEARRLARPDAHGKRVQDLEGGWGLHIEGAAAEMAVAKHLGQYWEGIWQDIDRTRGDVGDVQVRSTMREDGCLILYPRDLDDAMFVLVVGLAPWFRLAGAIVGRAGKRPEYWRTRGVRSPAYFVPQHALGGVSSPSSSSVVLGRLP